MLASIRLTTLLGRRSLKRVAPLVVGAIVTASCGYAKSVDPGTPLDISVIAQTVDGAPLPVTIEENPGATVQLVQFHLSLWPDGLWFGGGSRRPYGSTPGDTMQFNDNGSYSFDGTTLVIHSNLSHSDWVGAVNGDTITAQVQLSIADSPHSIVLVK